MSSSSGETDVQDETNNDEFQGDVSAVRASVDRALEILDERGEDVTVGRVVGAAVRVGSAGDHRFETYVRVARTRIGDREDGQ